MSLNLENELWLWKVEPVSPSVTPPLEIEDEWLSFKDETPAGGTTIEEEPVLYDEDEHPTRAQVATKLLEELDEWIKEGNIFLFSL